MKWKITYETMEGEKKVVKFECNADDLLALMNRMIVVRDGRVITNIEKKKGD